MATTEVRNMIETVHNPFSNTIEIPIGSRGSFDLTELRNHFYNIKLHGFNDLTSCIMQFDEGSINTPQILINWRREYRGDVFPACIKVDIFRKKII